MATLECWESYIRLAGETTWQTWSYRQPFKALSKNPTETDEVCGSLLPKPRAGSQSTLAMAANPWEEEQGADKKTTYVDILLKDTGLKTVDEVAICMWQRHVNQRTSMVAGDLIGVSECVRVQVDGCQISPINLTSFDAFEISCVWKYYGKWSICFFGANAPFSIIF